VCFDATDWTCERREFARRCENAPSRGVFDLPEGIDKLTGDEAQLPNEKINHIVQKVTDFRRKSFNTQFGSIIDSISANEISKICWLNVESPLAMRQFGYGAISSD